ncbi:MAG: FAD-dependent oxidoreductase [Lachnospiraceae bacterium]|nr:FAD-dependent oxidoreductase [Lachnospiraceae bacterium]
MIDKIIIGAGLYGLYAALYCARRGQEVVVLEMEKEAFSRATFVNQARVHMGYHYPRSLSTAMKSAGYFKRFVEDYGCCIHSEFDQVYATSSHFSWTDAKEFKKFCKDADIPCKDLPVDSYFKEGVCDGAFLTKEYTYDAHLLRDYILEQLAEFPNARIMYSRQLERIIKREHCYEVYAKVNDGALERYEAPFVLNATYASVNQVLSRVEGVETKPFALKYELCEIILCKVSENLVGTGLTVMDGPFFSIMPFGKTGYHSLTSVTFTPHKASFEEYPRFACQQGQAELCKGALGNCNTCSNHPESAWEYMAALARKYMRDEYVFTYDHSLFSMKPILKASEIDDSRPTVIKLASTDPTFVSVLSGKINTIYDLDEILK